ncbi:MAG: carboxypeptidase-like regulatory domain-containing protein [Candidatus Methanosuratincola sp.]
MLMQHKGCLVAILLLLSISNIAPPVGSDLNGSFIESSIVIANASVIVSGDNGYAVTATSQLGDFSIIDGLAVGTYDIEVSAPGYINAYLSGVNIYAGYLKDLGVISLRPSARIEGMVVGPNDEPISNISLHLVDEESGSVVAVSRSSASGTFAFDSNVRTGNYSITGYIDPYFPESGFGYITGSVSGIAATEGGTTSGILLRLNASGIIAGTVKDEYGSPVSGVTLRAFSIDGQSRFAFGKTDSLGRFNISTNLPSGRYNLTIYGITGLIFDTVSDSATVNLTAGSTSTVDFVLKRSGIISGRVVYSDNSPAESILVYAFTSDNRYFGYAYSNADGTYSINTGLGTGTYTVIANNEFSKSKTVSVRSGEETRNIDFKLSTIEVEKIIVTGRVLDSMNMPVSSATVFSPYDYTTSSDDGGYTIKIDLPAGQNSTTVQLTASKRGYYDGKINVTVVAGQGPVQADITMIEMPKGSVTGKVLYGPQKENAALNIRSEYSNVMVGQEFIVSGSSQPSRNGTVVYFVSKNGTGFINAGNSSMAEGRFAFSFVADAPGTIQIRAYWSGDNQYNPVESNTLSIEASPPSSKTPVEIMMSATAANVPPGSKIKLTGTATPLKGEALRLYGSVNDSVSDEIANLTLIEGVFFHTVVLNEGGIYSFYAVYPGDASRFANKSGAVTVTVNPGVKVTPVVTLNSSKTTITLSENVSSVPVTIYGRIYPPVAETQVIITVVDPANSKTNMTVNTSDSEFILQLNLNRRGTWSVVAGIPEGQIYASSNSSPLVITAVYAGAPDNTMFYIIGVGIVILALAVVLLIVFSKGR